MTVENLEQWKEIHTRYLNDRGSVSDEEIKAAIAYMRAGRDRAAESKKPGGAGRKAKDVTASLDDLMTF